MSRLTAGERNALQTARRCAASVEAWNKSAALWESIGRPDDAAFSRHCAQLQARHAFTIIACNRGTS